MWRKNKYITNYSETKSLKTIDKPTDKSMEWNDIKQAEILQFTIIDDLILTD